MDGSLLSVYSEKPPSTRGVSKSLTGRHCQVVDKEVHVDNSMSRLSSDEESANSVIPEKQQFVEMIWHIAMEDSAMVVADAKDPMRDISGVSATYTAQTPVKMGYLCLSTNTSYWKGCYTQTNPRK